MAQTRVLVISGDDATTELLNLNLEPRSFEVFHARNGPDGIEATRAVNPEVVILDLLIPDMDGWEICKQVREFSRVPILVLSPFSKPGIAARVLDEGADDYLQKPMASGVLVAHIRRLARRARAEKEAARSKYKPKKFLN
jgi:DNA-binding response OmpR family regulator